MVTAQSWVYAQQAILGAALIDERCVPLILSRTTEMDFTGACLTVYKAIRELVLTNAAVDPVSVAGLLGDQYRGFVAELMAITPTAANVEQYISLCLEESRIFRLKELGEQIAQTETLEQQRGLLTEASAVLADRPKFQPFTMADAMASFMERHSGEPVRYLDWPIAGLNRNLYVEKGDFIIIGAEPSVGKTAWALQCAWHFARHKSVGFFSLETSKEKLTDRLMASVMDVDLSAIKRNNLQHEDWDRICSRSGLVAERKLEMHTASGWTAADIQATTMMRGYEIILVDYVQLIQGPGDNRHSIVAGVSMALHTMAQNMEVIVIALSQLTVDNDRTGVPSLDSLRESKQLGQDADVVMMLSLEDRTVRSGPRLLTVQKNKEGSLGQFKLYFDGARQYFSRKPIEARAPVKGAPIAGQMELLPGDTAVPFE